jgi:hypothetical protein
MAERLLFVRSVVRSKSSQQMGTDEEFDRASQRVSRYLKFNSAQRKREHHATHGNSSSHRRHGQRAR